MLIVTAHMFFQCLLSPKEFYLKKNQNIWFLFRKASRWHIIFFPLGTKKNYNIVSSYIFLIPILLFIIILVSILLILITIVYFWKKMKNSQNILLKDTILVMPITIIMKYKVKKCLKLHCDETFIWIIFIYKLLVYMLFQ